MTCYRTSCTTLSLTDHYKEGGTCHNYIHTLLTKKLKV